MRSTLFGLGAVVLIVIGLLGYDYYSRENEAEKKSQELVRKYKSEERVNPPSGYLIPGPETTIPSRFQPSIKRYTDSSSNISYVDPANNVEFISFIENSNENFYDYVQRETGSTVQDMRIVKEFTYENRKGVILGEFTKFSSTPTEYRLLYNHDGRLVMIHTTTPEVFRPDTLINLLKTLKPAL